MLENDYLLLYAAGYLIGAALTMFRFRRASLWKIALWFITVPVIFVIAFTRTFKKDNVQG
jgi:hypothetical protein